MWSSRSITERALFTPIIAASASWTFSKSAKLTSHRLLKDIGVEPLGNEFNGAFLASRFRKKSAPLKAALLDQRIIAGLGNIYVNEVLYRSALSPRRKAGTLVRKISHDARLNNLVRHVRDVLNEAIAAGGSTLRDFSGTDGSEGAFQQRFAVYDREGEDCPRTGCRGTIRRIVQSAGQPFTVHPARNRKYKWPTKKIISETRDAVGIITLNRPKALNALNSQLIDELNSALSAFQEDSSIGCVVITGSEKAFAAGADIREMKDKTFTDVYLGDFLATWDRITEFRKPIIAAVQAIAWVAAANSP